MWYLLTDSIRPVDCANAKKYIVVVAVKERKSNCNLNEKEVSKIVADYKRCKYTCSD
jgi:hypothetical protein